MTLESGVGNSVFQFCEYWGSLEVQFTYLKNIRPVLCFSILLALEQTGYLYIVLVHKLLKWIGTFQHCSELLSA